MPKTYISQLLHQITDFQYRVTAVIDGDIIYLIQVRGVEICVAYITVLCESPSRWLGLYSFNYVWKLCYQRITRLLYGIYSDQKYKN